MPRARKEPANVENLTCILPRQRSCVWPLCTSDGLGRPIDKKTIKQIARLSTRIAMIMDDCCDEAVSLGRMDRQTIVDSFKDLAFSFCFNLRIVDSLEKLYKRIEISGMIELRLRRSMVNDTENCSYCGTWCPILSAR